ncbi:MAG: hypothetical protein MMC33_006336 [Icmadophila ericetorum]|nr:hypothetical protein [Icmadophila ericetorum]
MPSQSESDFALIKAYARINVGFLPFVYFCAPLRSLAYQRQSLDKPHEPTQFFDCKFYPYTPPGVDPVFALVGKTETIVCRPVEAADSGVEIIRWFHEEDEAANINSCTWSHDLASGDPLLCVSGSPSTIKIFNVRSGELVKTLTGHGKEVNDLAVSPMSPTILASASMDHSVRLWSLDPKYEKQPCMLICAGEGHKEGLLTLAFHSTGRYLLTGGMDCVVNLWTIPELPDNASGTDKPTIIHYPHFSTSALHTDFVDCILWYDDFILSKCASECKIILWRIEGFNSADPPPPPGSAPTTHEFRPTRSAFGGTYQRLLQFEAHETTPFYMRFSIFDSPNKRPLLVIGNEKSKIFFWDLQALEEWDGKVGMDGDFKMPKSTLRRGVARKIINTQRESSTASTGTTTTNTTSTSAIEDEKGSSKAKLRYAIDDPLKGLLPHKTQVVPKVTFAARQAAWSVGGEWLVVVGDQGMMALFAR